MTIQEYNEIFKYPIVKQMTLTFFEEGYQDIVLTNADICSEEMSLEESLCSEENLRFGACESSCFKIRVVNNNSFKGKYVAVQMKIVVDDDRYLIDAQGNRIVTDKGEYIIVNTGKKDNIIYMGIYKVHSDEPTNDRMWRDLVCYDLMYDILNAEVSDFYNEAKQYLPMDLKTFRNGFFAYLVYTHILPEGVVQENVTLVNDDFMVEGGFIAEENLSGKTIIEAICELNGCFGHFDYNYFRYISLPSSETITPGWYINDESGKYEDFVINKITGVTARSEASDVGTSVGTDVNRLIIENNPLVYGKEGTQELTTALTNILNNVKDIQYRPFSLNTYGNPCLPLGTSLVINTKKYDTQNGYVPFVVNSFVQSKVMNGIQGLVDSLSATGSQSRPTEANSLQSQIKRTAGKVHKVQVDLENFISEIEDEDYSTRINQNAQAITLEAERAKREEEKYGVSTGYDTWTYDGKNYIKINTDLILDSYPTNRTRIAVWVKDIPAQYDSYIKYINFSFKYNETTIRTDSQIVYYTGTTYLTDQYKNGVVLHLVYMVNQQFTVDGQTRSLTGWWVGADDSLARLQITADSITSYVGQNYVSNATYDAEIQNLQDQIDGRIEYWDGNVVPTLSNAPASSWTTDADKSSHVGDLYRYHHGTPEVIDYYRFDKDSSTTPATYSWVALGASEVDEALRKAEEANAKADAAQAQLDQFEITTAGNFTQVRQDIASVNTTVSGVTAREFKSVSFTGTPADYSTDGKIYTITPTLESVDNDTKLSILLQSIPWESADAENPKKKYIKINSDTMSMGDNTFPIYYSQGEQLTNQIGLGNFLNIRYVTNYETSSGTYQNVFVVDKNDQTYKRLESELDIERGRMVLRVRSSDGQLVEQSLDATGSASVWKVKADNIDITAAQAMSFLAGGTMTLAGQNGIVINSPNFNVYRDGSVVVRGNIQATSLTLVGGETIDVSDISGLADIATSGSYSDLSGTPNLNVYVQKDGTIGNTPAEGATGFRVSSQGLLTASNAVIYGRLISSSGTIGGWTLASNRLYSNTISLEQQQIKISRSGVPLGNSVDLVLNNDGIAMVASGGYSGNLIKQDIYVGNWSSGSVGDILYNGRIACVTYFRGNYSTALTIDGQDIVKSINGASGNTWGDSNRASLNTALMNTLYASYGKGTTTLTGVVCFGFITSSGQDLCLYIPISLRYSVTSVTATNASISVRTPKGGYIISSGAGIGNPTCSILRGQNMLFVRSSRSSRWTYENGDVIPNNTCVTGQITFTATFA